MVFCGIDWGERLHHVAVVDSSGKCVARARIADSVVGFAELTGLLAGVGASKRRPVPVAIETPHGLLVAALLQAGCPVYAINPLAVARYRTRLSVSGSKSDHADAMLLANILRTDLRLHRRIAADSELATSVAVLARAHQDAVWRRTSICQKLRALLHDYYPAFLHLFAPKMNGLHKPEARLLLAAAPTPAAAARLTAGTVEGILRRAGRSRGIEARAAQIVAGFAQPQLRQPEGVQEAMGEHALALLGILDAECANVDGLAATIDTQFRRHPDAAILLSFAGLGVVTGARILAEIGDDRQRFTTARGLKAYAGSAPITKASGRALTITHRFIKNNRLTAACILWASSAILHLGPERRHYLHRRARGDRHVAALRHLFNRMLGQLYHCLQTGQHFDQEIGYPEYVATAAYDAMNLDNPSTTLRS